MRFKRPEISWALFDFAQTIFAMNIVSFYFALWVTVEKGKEDIFYSVAIAVSLVCAMLIGVLLGTVSDIRGGKKTFLVLAAVLCAVFTASLTLADQVLSGLILFALANCAFRITTIFYNALLPGVSRRGRMGELSGLGVALGYVGAAFGLAVTKPLVARWGYSAAFLPTGLLFLLFALPCFFFVREPEPDLRGEPWPGLTAVFERIKATFSPVRGSPALIRFLVAGFVFLNAVNTVIIFMSVYIKKVFGLADQELIRFFFVVQIFAMLGSYCGGVLTDRKGPKRVLTGTLVCWVAVLFTAALVRDARLLWVVGPLAAVSLGSTWASSRVLAIRLCPGGKLGEVFALFSMVGKFSAVVGPLIWGSTLLIFDFLGPGKYRLAIFLQGVLILAGLLILVGGRGKALDDLDGENGRLATDT